jgi:hypothetical protein
MKTPSVICVDRSEAGVIVDFSDATAATYSAEELCKLRPNRTTVEPRDILGDVIVSLCYDRKPSLARMRVSKRLYCRFIRLR